MARPEVTEVIGIPASSPNPGLVLPRKPRTPNRLRNRLSFAWFISLLRCRELADRYLFGVLHTNGKAEI